MKITAQKIKNWLRKNGTVVELEDDNGLAWAPAVSVNPADRSPEVEWLKAHNAVDSAGRWVLRDGLAADVTWAILDMISGLFREPLINTPREPDNKAFRDWLLCRSDELEEKNETGRFDDAVTEIGDLLDGQADPALLVKWWRKWREATV